MAGGKITRIALGGSSTLVEGDFTGFYDNLGMSAGDNNAFKAKVTNHGKPEKTPRAGKFFVKGWWTNHKDEPIKRAIYGQVLRFHIEMDKEFTKEGDIVYFGMYDSDMRSFGNDAIKADDPIALEHKDGSHTAYTYEKVNNELKVIIEFSTTDALEQWTRQLDEDMVFELYFRCSYVNGGETEHVEMPYNFHDYLNLGAIVIDRYKMPGLNLEGTDIADDMAYGAGKPYKHPVYDTASITQYKKEYALFGFNSNLHSDFANKELAATQLEEVTVTAKRIEPKPQANLNAAMAQPRDNTYVAPVPSFTPEEINERLQKQNEKNRKAIYSREEIKKLGTLMNLTASSDNESGMWFDFKAMSRGILSRGKLNDNIGLMISKMQRNEGGIFENPDLTAALLENPATRNYLMKVEDYIAEQLKSKFSKLEDVEDKEPYFAVMKGDQIDFFKNTTKGKRIKQFRSPAYTWSENWNVLRGETIALNDIWAAEVILKEVKMNGEDYTAKYEVTLWDHFGLDKPDMEKFYSYGAGFRAWFVLQHIFGYKPFLTRIKFTKELKNNLKTGASERQAQRAKEKKEAEEAEKIRMMQELMSGPKF